MKAKMLVVLAAILLPHLASAFCGFYVAKAGAELFNNTSQVIIVRDGTMNKITMMSDFKGKVEDFAMVVPVPVVLQRNQISVVEKDVFKKFDNYSAPRMAEYFDPTPCPQPRTYTNSYSRSMSIDQMSVASISGVRVKPKAYGVKVQAKYKVDEYEILILSAKKSKGLEEWLIDNGYNIPAGAKEVLEPYIKNKMKFFVVKVDLSKVKNTGDASTLRPLKIEYDSPRFMLPIRLGMANAKGAQDMLVYCLTKNGRVETTNYRTVLPPTNNEIPSTLKSSGNFGGFYSDLFTKQYESQGKNAVFLEYAWDISGNAGVKCDPCPSPPPVLVDMVKVGADWLKQLGGNYVGKVFFTRLHVRYDRDNFPQDLMFQETPNKQRFQCRYVIRNPAPGPYTCGNAQTYLKNLRSRRVKEVKEMCKLTNWDPITYASYITEYDQLINDPVDPVSDLIEVDQGAIIPAHGAQGIPPQIWIILGAIVLAGLSYLVKNSIKP